MINFGTKKDHNMEMCISQGERFAMFFLEELGNLEFGFSMQNAKCFRNSSLTLGGILVKLGTKKDYNVEMCILQEECCPMFFKGVRALGLSFSMQNTVFATLAKPLGNFDETWYQARKDHNL